MSTHVGEEQKAKVLCNIWVRYIGAAQPVYTHIHPETSFVNGTFESASLSRGSPGSPAPLRLVHKRPAIARPVPPTTYIILLFLKRNSTALLGPLDIAACPVENRQHETRGRRRATRNKHCLGNIDDIISRYPGEEIVVLGFLGQREEICHYICQY